jgi:ADP-ribosylglycohydrolase
MQDRNRVSIEDRVLGGLIGGAIGDALGAPMECMHYQRIREVFGDARRFSDFTPAMLEQSLFRKNAGKHGFVTDDTVLADLLLDCILENNGEITAIEFARQWEKFEDPVPNPDGDPVIRIKHMH